MLVKIFHLQRRIVTPTLTKYHLLIIRSKLSQTDFMGHRFVSPVQWMSHTELHFLQSVTGTSSNSEIVL